MGIELTYIVSAEEEGMRLDEVLAERGAYPSRSAAAKAIDTDVFVNAASKKKSYQVLEDDVITCIVNEKPKLDLKPRDIALDIRFEDDYLLVISKQAGLVCHPAIGHEDNTLVNALMFHCGADHLCTAQGGMERAGIIHRLDRDTSGLMICAKTNEAAQILMQDIQNRVVQRHYLALCHGIFKTDTGMISGPITRSAHERNKMAVRDIPQSREAITTFEVKERYSAQQNDNGYSLVDCKLFTGRTHQIRVHLEYIKHPVVGDPLYMAGTPKKPSAQLGLKRQFLHSYKLGFRHPITKEELYFEDNLSQDLEKARLSIAKRAFSFDFA
ncbi:MAG: RluA family pseudouridine synthase [Eggerthellaceae bacterium]|nr:RluA family pseudouridine synthase [Eggerthellaceae bacterium]